MKKFCTNCGQEIDGNVSFCPNCGQKIGDTKNSNKTNGNTTNNNANQNTYTPKSKMAAGILGILLGSLGVHNFYLGYTGKAVAQLLISILSCGILAFASGIWGLVEGILILTGSINTDAQGNPLGD